MIKFSHYCFKEEKRTINNLFTMYSCNQCSNYQTDEVIFIGKNKIYLFPIKEKCKDIPLLEEDICFSKRIRLFLKDAILHPEIIVLWLDDFSLKKCFDILPSFLNKGDLAIIY